ncbi:MAG: hypothetical protein MUF07_01785 [Steroidobacteraceae bacterium]|nr:hypothetical protein [Steroidobacteraceae bacterium]
MVTSFLGDLRGQIALVERQCSLDVRIPDMRSAVDQARTLTSPLNLGVLWRSLKGNYLRPQDLTHWQWAGAMVAPEQAPLEQADLDDLVRAIDELEAAANSPGVPLELQAFFLRNALELRPAVSRYRVLGARALADEIDRWLGEISRHGARLATAAERAPEASQTVVEKAQAAFDKFASVCGKAEDIYKWGERAYLFVLTHDAKIAPLMKMIGQLTGG